MNNQVRIPTQEPCSSAMAAILIENERKAAAKRAARTENQRKRRARMTEEQINQRRENDKKRFAEANLLEKSNKKRRKRQRDSEFVRDEIESAMEHSAAQNEAFNESLVVEHYCGMLNEKCSKCNAKHFQCEQYNGKKESRTYTKCCKNGQVELEPLHEYPEPFLSLMKKTGINGINFMDNIRSINSSFGFASMGANIDPPKGYGPFCFRVHGQIYHRSGTLHPIPGEPRQYAQLYILDSEQANEQRIKHSANVNVNQTVFKLISDFMEINNPLCRAYKMMHEVEQECLREAERNGITNVSEVTMAIVNDRNKDPRRYNAAKANEVAIIFSNKDGMPPFERDLLVYQKCLTNDAMKGMRRISILHKSLEAMVYPLLFPYDDQGWGADLERNRTGSRVRISQMEYYCYRFAIRDEFNPLLNAGKLTHQYFVDCYVKMEGNRLNYIRQNQKEWRGDTLKGLQDFVASEAERQGKKPGSAVILPSSFPGGPRYMQQNYQDAMSIVTKYGKPDLFVTVTCNPKWIEITENLEPWQNAEHRPDLVARVFDLKLKSLLHDITNKEGGVFGKVSAYVYVIEFQKRGLPHAHILLILDKHSKLDTEEKIDKFVKAEIPDIELNPRLFKIVTSHMVHGPCGKDKPNSPCMKNGVCLKKFPKSFQIRTLGNKSVSDGYALYKRRKGPVIRVKGRDVDNSFIVPYNPYLLLKYNCHINVEVCASVQSVKYLFKYVYKGHDCASVKVTDPNVLAQDEIQTHVDSRYVSAPEAAWRMFGNEMHAQSHSVERLAVHLQEQQWIVINANPVNEYGKNQNADTDPKDEISDARQNQLKNAADKDTTLTAWFKLNKEFPDARLYYYWEIPLHYTWLKGERKWKVREKFFNKIGRMYTVSPKDAERFYLRLLLLHVKGALGFDDLLTVGGVKYDTFRESAKARGLLIEDDVWQKTLDDAIACQMPAQLRQVFAYICAYCSPTNPAKLWRDNISDLIEDMCHKLHGSKGECRQCELYAIMDLKQTLNILGKSLSVACLQEPPDNLDFGNEETFNEEYENEEGWRMRISLNEEQSAAFCAIIDAIDNGPGHNYFFIDGPGGSGKTYLYQTLIHTLRGMKQNVLATASTGIAANLLSGGRTYHSLFRFGIPITETTVSTIAHDSVEANNIRFASLIIIDECTMASSHAIDAIDRSLRDFMNNDMCERNK